MILQLARGLSGWLLVVSTKLQLGAKSIPGEAGQQLCFERAVSGHLLMQSRSTDSLCSRGKKALEWWCGEVFHM